MKGICKYLKGICKYLTGLCVIMLILILAAPLSAEAEEPAECADSADNSAECVGNADWRWPVPVSNTLSSCYMDGRNHYAIDIHAPEGSEVFASYEGEVIFIYTGCSHNYPKSGSCGCNGDLGNSVSIRHTYNGVEYVSRYGHLTTVEVAVGDHVTADTLIGTVGSTGYSMNYHLDFRMYRGNGLNYDRAADCVDPLKELFLAIPEGINATKSSTGCCYAYMSEVEAVYEEFWAKKAAEEEKARIAAEEAKERAEQQAFESAVRHWIQEEVIEVTDYLNHNIFEVGFGLENFINHYH